LEFENAQNFYNDALLTAEPGHMIELFGYAIDAFNLAGKLALANKDTEVEAISEAKLGNIFYKGLKNNLKARQHFYDCLRLCNTLYPKIVTD
jgi:hypothetical protein